LFPYFRRSLDAPTIATVFIAQLSLEWVPVRRPVLTLFLLAFLTFFAGLGQQAITDSDEAFYAEAAREMVEGGDWLTPHWNYADRWQKPILYYWLTAGLYTFTGPTEAAARFWSAFSGLGLVLLTWTATRHISRRDDTAWLAGAIVATAFGYFFIARLALPDLPLTFTITLTLWAVWRGAARDEPWWWALAGVATALGFLLKGPVAVVVPAVVTLPAWWRERRSAAVSVRSLAIAGSLLLAIAAPWFIAMWRVHGTAYLDSFFVGDNIRRFATEQFNERRWPGYYIPIVLGGLMPWTAFVVALAITPARQLWLRTRTLSGDEWRLLCWAVMPLLFYSISTGQQPRYILPVLPPIAMLLAIGMIRRVDDARAHGSPGRAFVIAAWVTVALFAIVLVLIARARPLFVSGGAPLLALGATGLAAAMVLSAVRTRRWARVPAIVALSSAVMLLSVQLGALSGARPEPVEQLAALVAEHRRGDEPVGEYKAFIRNMVFYTQFRQTEIYEGDADPLQPAAMFLSMPTRVLLVTPEAELAALEARLGRPLRRLGAVRYFDTNKMRLPMFIAPDTRAHLATVVLVSNE
jgi:4-amino-4-deoxy-L-arabinose transferase-like glycosyltransferase